MWTLTTAVALTPIQYSYTSIVYVDTAWALSKSTRWTLFKISPWSLSKGTLELYPKVISLNYNQKYTPRHNPNLRIKYSSNMCMHPNLHLSKFPSFIPMVTESIDRNIHLDWLNYIHTLVIIVNTETWIFHALTIIHFWRHTSQF